MRCEKVRKVGAAEDGEQTIRIIFDSPQIISRNALWFEENNVVRTQEFALLWPVFKRIKLA